MSYNPDIHHRHSIRLKGYDYSQNGMYFVTICVQNRENLFSETMDTHGDFLDVKINNGGKMIQKWWQELQNKFPNVALDRFVIMPNHFHGMIQINNVGANLCVRPDNNERQGRHVGLPVRNPSLSTIIQWFKTMTTNEYIRGVKSGIYASFDGHLWQRNYYEHIIQDENELNNIREYITNNPRNWEKDSLFH